jgi:hypothetical protein
VVVEFLRVIGHTILGVLNGAVLDVNLLNGVVRTSTDGADGDTVATSALGAGEGDILGRISKRFTKASSKGMRTVPELTAKQSSWLWTTGLVM